MQHGIAAEVPEVKLIASDRSKTVSNAVHAPPAYGPRRDARRSCVGVNLISADGTRRVAVPVLVRVYAFVADCTPRPTVAVAVSAGVLTTDPASRIAVSISVGVYGAAAVNAGRIARSIRVKDAILAAGEPASALPPDSAIRALILGSARAALVARLSLSMISRGVPLGAPRPNQTLAS